MNSKSDAASDAAASGNFLTGTLQETGPNTCITATLVTNNGSAQCTVVQHFAREGGVSDENVASCIDDNLVAPCWALTACTTGAGMQFEINSDLVSPNPADVSFSYKCTICPAGSQLPGCN